MLEIYTDGSCMPNSGAGGWAYVVVREGVVIAEKSGCVLDTTNNRMEMLAIIYALEDFAAFGEALTVYSDSVLAVNGFSGIWKQKSNVDLWKTGMRVLQSCRASVCFQWVKGHAGHEFNERADVLADAAARHRSAG